MPHSGSMLKIEKNSSGQPVCGPYGMDEVDFLISPNKGENLKPVENIASGGEISKDYAGCKKRPFRKG